MSDPPLSRGFRGRRGGADAAAVARVPPGQHVTADSHCVTKWSKLDTGWGGVAVDALLAAAGLQEPPAPFAMLHCDGGYTTNLPLADMLEGKAMVALRHGGAPLAPEHGGPARLLVPHLYFWKSAKWVRRLRFLGRGAPRLLG